MNSETIIERDGYLVDGETGEKIVWYECDPSKNSECDKVLCRSAYVDQEHNFGFCAKTADPRFRKDRGRAWYAVKKTPTDGGEPYWGREYIEEGTV